MENIIGIDDVIEDNIASFNLNQISKLHSNYKYWPWKNTIDAKKLNYNDPSFDSDKLDDIKEDGIYNRSIILATETQGFTPGLIFELKRIQKLNFDAMYDTILFKLLKK